MASTTKLMTTLIALEYAQKQDDIVEFTADMVTEGSSMYLEVGDRVHLSDLAAGMMMASGNDAANAVALHIGKSFEEFAKLMNSKAAEIGMKNTSFVTPSGLDDENHYSTAYDMALLMTECMKNKEFSALSACSSKTVSFVKPADRVVTYSNHNKLLSKYEHCTGGKTGYTDAAGRCLVTSAENEGASLVAVTLNAPDDWNDHINLYEYGFSLYTQIELEGDLSGVSLSVAGSNRGKISVKAKSVTTLSVTDSKKENITQKIYLPDFVYAPVKKGDTVGKIKYISEGATLAEADLVAFEEAPLK